jgi:type IX secretion system PorP/SprF family membrane protein
MKRIVLILITIVWIGRMYGQQSPLYTQYIQNPFVINPAVAGTLHFFQIKMIQRVQWVGFNDAPITTSLSFFGPISPKNKDMGYGGTFYNDVTGPTSRLGVNGSYAYNVKINETQRISFGAALGIMQFKFDGTKINLPDDKSAPQAVTNIPLLEGLAGVYFWDSNFQIGLSADNLFNNSINLDNSGNSKALSKLSRDYYLFGSYRFILNRRWNIESATGIRFVGPSVVQFDLSAKAEYKKSLIFGVAYRLQDAVSAILGYQLTKNIYLGYSLDISTSQIYHYSFGTHEILIGYRFNSMK